MSEPDNILKFRRTPAVNRLLLFLEECDAAKGSSVDLSELTSVKSSFPSKDKPLLHLILTACLSESDPLLSAAFNDEEIQDLFSSLLSIVEGIKLREELYWDLLTALGLDFLEDCLCLIVSCPNSKFSFDTMTHLVALLESKKYPKRETFLMLSTLLKILGMETGEYGERYMDCFQHLALYAYEEDHRRFDRFTTLFRLLAQALWKSPGENDKLIERLAKEWGFLHFGKGEHLPEKSLRTYQALFQFKFKNLEGKGKKDLLKICEILHDSIPLDPYDLLSDGIEEIYGVQFGAKSVTHLEYSGAMCYFVKLLFEQHSPLVDWKAFPKFESLFEFLLEHKPKLFDEELIWETKCFQDFYGILMRRGMGLTDEDDDQDQDWRNTCIDHFLSFKLEEIIKSGKESLKAAGALFGKADCEKLVVFFLKLSGEMKQLEDENEELPEEWRKLVLKLVMSERFGGKNEEERDMIIKALYDDKQFGMLELEGFMEELNTVISQVGTIEMEGNAEKLAEHKDAILHLCFQNPYISIRKILEQSIRVEAEQFRALEFCRPFFALRKDNDNGDSDSDTLLVDCLLKILKHLPEYPCAIYDSIGKSFPALISHDFLDPLEVFILLRGKIIYLMEKKDISMNSILGGVALLEAFLKKPNESGPGEWLQDALEFVVKLNRFFCQFTNGRTFAEAMQIREKLIYMEARLSKVVKVMELPSLEDLEEKDLSELGLLYIRVPQLRTKIETLFRRDEEDYFRDLDLATYVNFLTNWILNSCQVEWPSLNELIFKIGYPLIPRLKRSRKIVLLNKSLISAYVVFVSCGSGNSQKQVEIFSHVLKFYTAAVEYLKSEKEGEFGFTENDWFGLMDTLLSIGAVLSEAQLQLETDSGAGRKKSHVLTGSKMRNAQVLYKILNVFLKQVEEYGHVCENMKSLTPEGLLAKLKKIENLDPKCESVMWVVKETLKKMCGVDEMNQESEIVA